MNDYGLEIIEKKIKDFLSNELLRTGLLFRLYSRIKEQNSIDEKIARKSYSADSNLMQDLIGFRITTYFNDDLKIVVGLCEKIFEKIDLVYDEPTSEVFKPLRKNMICRMPKDQIDVFKDIKKDNSRFDLVDSSFEIQFRTTLSEGWHEVDHLMRYKCKDDWNDLIQESRMLNGIYATLETNDQTLRALFDDIAYQHYKLKKWEAMLRNKLRLRFSLKNLNSNIVDCLNSNDELGKKIFRLNRHMILTTYLNSELSFPTTFDNWVFFINYYFIKNETLHSITPPFLLEEFEMAFKVSQPD